MPAKVQVITKAEQHKLLRYAKDYAGANTHLRHGMILAYSYTLGAATPPHWIINLACGRTDRLFEEVE